MQTVRALAHGSAAAASIYHVCFIFRPSTAEPLTLLSLFACAEIYLRAAYVRAE
jgi:hypothetical protein